MRDYLPHAKALGNDDVQQNVEEQSTLAGAVPPAPLTRELHSSTLAELEGLIIGTVEEQQTICVCQMILTISSTRVECKNLAILVE